MKKILVVDDDAAHRMMLTANLSAEGYAVAEADDGTTALAAVRADFYDLIVMDVRMTAMDGLEALAEIKTLSPGIPVLMMTAYPSVAPAVKAMKLGAVDYLSKPLDMDELRLRIAKLLGRYTRNDDHPPLTTELSDTSRLIGSGERMRQLFDTLALVAPTDTTVLILGESGTGKEAIADTIHANSLRAKKPLIKVNCAALPETLLESELFGHEKGAFTGAAARREGRFEVADGGTIFLDEIGDMPVTIQVKLLRVLQEQQFEPLGSSRTKTVNVRVIAATNRHLEADIEAGRFREDLYYRLNVFPLLVPALRDRKEDLPQLAEFFLARHVEKHRRTIKGFAPRALDVMMRYDWKGNIRELENTVERSVILCREEFIAPHHLPAHMQAIAGNLPPETPDAGGGLTLREMEKHLILSTLAQNDNNRTKTADALGISRRSLQMKLKEYGIN